MALFFTDLECDIDQVTLHSDVGGFSSGMVNKQIEIISGTNFIVGLYTIADYTDTNNVTIDATACDGVGDASAGKGSVGFLGWILQEPEPLPRVPIHWFADLTDPTWMVYAPVEMSSWFLQPPEPVLPRPPSPMLYAVEPLDQTLYQIPDMDSWFLQPPGPVERVQRAIQQFTVEPELPHEDLIPKMDTWFQETQRPVLPLAPRPMQYSVEPLVETLYQIPDVNEWFLQPPEPICRVPQTIITEITPHPEWRELTLPSGALSWCVQQPDPIFPQWNDRQTEIAQRAAMTLTDATFEDTDTHIFQRGDEDDDVYKRT